MNNPSDPHATRLLREQHSPVEFIAGIDQTASIRKSRGYPRTLWSERRQAARAKRWALVLTTNVVRIGLGISQGPSPDFKSGDRREIRIQSQVIEISDLLASSGANSKKGGKRGRFKRRESGELPEKR
jgi:hypothetical protein